MNVGFERPLPPAAPAAVDGLETSLGVKLPEAYKAFLMKQNGGLLEPNFFDEDIGVRYFFSASPTADEHVKDVAAVAEMFGPNGAADYEIDPDKLPIGEDDFGNIIAIDLGEDNGGAIYFWDHESTSEDDAYRELTPTLSAFIDALRPESELA